MSTKSKIEWTDSTWNPITGCNKISPGCKFCYAERLSKRLKIMGSARYENGFKLSLHYDLVKLPLNWKTPRVIFVNSMSDLFHKNVPFVFIKEIFETMNAAHWHTFQILTKRSDILAEYSKYLKWTQNIWMGVSVESQKYVNRIDDLRKVPSSVRFLSIEPLIARITNIELKEIDWVIVGGESGPSSRKVERDWILEIRDKCIREDVPFFFKQWGGINKKRSGRILEGRTWDELPEPKVRNSIENKNNFNSDFLQTQLA